MMATTIERILRFGSRYHARLSCGHRFDCDLDRLNEWQIFIGKRWQCDECSPQPLAVTVQSAEEENVKQKNPAAVELGRKGGQAKTSKPKGLAALSPEERRRIATAGGKKRAADVAKAKKRSARNANKSKRNV